MAELKPGVPHPVTPVNRPNRPQWRLELKPQLELERCPHCGIDRPNLHQTTYLDTMDHAKNHRRFWGVYKCSRCGGLVLAASPQDNGVVNEVYPQVADVDSAIPGKARAYLEQAINSIHAPAGAVMLAASSVDAMLKEKGYKEGHLYLRIDKAAKEQIITSDMAKWAHDIRLDANGQRHADEAMTLPTPDDAQRCVDFALALGQFMFVLPARVQRGISNARKPDNT